MAKFAFVHYENFRYLSGLGREHARDLSGILEHLDANGGLISEFMRAIGARGRSVVYLPPGLVRVCWDEDAGEVSYWYDSFLTDEMAPLLEQGRQRYGDIDSGCHSVMLVLKKNERRVLITMPLGAVIKTARPIFDQHQVYSHTFVHDDAGKVLQGASYIGVTKRGWRTRWAEHVSAAQRGSRYRFHEAIRQWSDRATTISHGIIAAGKTEQQAMALEERMVGLETLYPRGLNMIPGGYAGLAYLRKIGAIQRHDRTTADDKHEIINRFFRACAQNGHANPLVAALWNDSAYAERVICSGDDRLKPDQIRAARFMSSIGRAAGEISAEIGARNMEQVRRLLRGDTYSRIA